MSNINRITAAQFEALKAIGTVVRGTPVSKVYPFNRRALFAIIPDAIVYEDANAGGSVCAVMVTE